MTRYLVDVGVRLALVRHPGQTVLNVEFDSEAIREWSLALSLLKERLIASLVVREKGAKGKLEIRLLEEMSQLDRAQASFDSEVARLILLPRDLDYLLHFFLKYHRDGAAEVDHIDLEVLSTAENCATSITFKVPEAVQPLSAEEAKERLGLH